MARAAIANLAAEMARPTTPGEIRAALRTALADTSLEVAYWVPDRGGYVDVDVDGWPVPEAQDSSASLVIRVTDREGQPLAIISADPSLCRHRQLVDAAVAVSA